MKIHKKTLGRSLLCSQIPTLSPGLLVMTLDCSSLGKYKLSDKAVIDHSSAPASGGALTLGEGMNLYLEKVERNTNAGGEAAEGECQGSLTILYLFALN